MGVIDLKGIWVSGRAKIIVERILTSVFHISNEVFYGPYYPKKEVKKVTNMHFYGEHPLLAGARINSSANSH